MKEILILTTLPQNGTTGVQSHLNTVSKNLSKLGVSNTVITPYTFKPSIAHRLKRKLIHAVAKIDIERAIILNREHLLLGLKTNIKKHTNNKDKKYFIYAQDPGSALVARDIGLKSVETITLICHFNISEINEYHISHGIHKNGKLADYFGRRERAAFKISTSVIFPSKYLKNIVTRRNTVTDLETKAVVINNFVDDFRPTKHSTTQNYDFLSIGTLEPRKNQEYALRLLASLHKLGFRKRIVFIGDGPDKPHLEILAKELGLANFAMFLGFKENARSYLSGAKFLLHTAKIENFPITLIESLCQGVPICAAPAGGIPEIYSDGTEGVYIDLGNAAKSAKKIATLFDPAVYRTLSKHARQRYEKYFTPHENIIKLCRVIQGEASPSQSSCRPITHQTTRSNEAIRHEPRN